MIKRRIKITITYDDFEKSSRMWATPGRCPFTVAARRLFNTKEVWAGGCSVTVVKRYFFGLFTTRTCWVPDREFGYSQFKKLRDSGVEFSTFLTKTR
jgi:hypothetical protein